MIPEKLIIAAKGECKPGLAVLLRFKMIQKNDYSLIVFLDGSKTEVAKEELLSEFDQTANFFLMDYVNARGGFTGQIEANLLSKEEIKAAIRAYETFKNHSTYPPEYLSNLRKALAVNSEAKCTVTVEQI